MGNKEGSGEQGGRWGTGGEVGNYLECPEPEGPLREMKNQGTQYPKEQGNQGRGEGGRWGGRESGRCVFRESGRWG